MSKKGREMSSETHTIDLDEMLTWLDDRRRASVLYASSSREWKSLEVACAGGYAVLHRGEVVWEGTDGKTAVEKYNAINSK